MDPTPRKTRTGRRHVCIVSFIQYQPLVLRGAACQGLALTAFPQIVAEETAPDGMLYRGNYEAYSKFMDDDHNTHLEFNWRFEIKKTWD